MAVLSEWSPPWRTPGGIPSSQATDAEVAAAISEALVKTESGPPTTGTHEVGTIAVDEDGYAYINILAGTPGTWLTLNAGRELARGTYSVEGVALTRNTNTVGDMDASLSITFEVVSRPVQVEFFSSLVFNNTINGVSSFYITDEANTQKGRSNFTSPTVNAAAPIRVLERAVISTPGTYTRKMRFACTAGTIVTVQPKTAGVADFTTHIRAFEV